MISKLKKAFTVKRVILILSALLLVVAGIVGYMVFANTGDKTEGAAESEFRKQMADAGVTKIAVKKNLVLESPVEVKGTKILYGKGSITAVGAGWAGDEYMIQVPAGAQLTVKEAVTVNADGLAGGIHASKDAVWSIEETACVKNASAKAANTLVEGVFQMKGGTMSGAKGHNVYNKGEVTVSQGEIIGSGEKYAGIYNEGTLTQDGGTVRNAYNNVSVVSGSFRFTGGNNLSSIHDGIYAAEGTKLTVTNKSAVVSGSGVRGIYLCGDGVIANITLESSGDTLLKVSRTGTLDLSGGTLADAGYHSIENAGSMVMTGGSIRNSYNCGIVNTGALEITGGSFMDNTKNKAVLNKHDGTATISGAMVMFSGNRYAIANQDTATLDLTGAEILLSTVTNIYAYDGKVNIHDISLGASGSNNVRIYKAEVTMNNVEVLGNSKSGSASTHGILLEGGVLNATDVAIKNTTGYGIRNKGGHVTVEDLLISKSIKAGGIINGVQDHTGLPGIMDVKNLTIEDIRYNNVVVDGGTVTVTKGEFKASGTNNTKITGGTLNLKDVTVYGNLPDTDGTNHAVYSTGGTLVAENVTIKNAKVTGLRVNGETAVIKGSKLSIENSPKYGIDLSAGKIDINGLTMSGNHYNITTNGGSIKLRNSNLGATVSNNVRVNEGGSVELRNVVIKGHTPNHTANVHALFVDKGKLTGEKITVRNVANVGLRVKGGTVTVQGLTVEDAGTDGIWIDGGKATVHDLVVKKAGSAGISATNTGDVTVIGGSINNTANHGVKCENEAKLALENITVSIATTSGRHAVLAQGGDIQLNKVKITGLESNTAGFGIRINRDTSHVSGNDIHIADVNTGISATAGTAELSGVTTQNITAHSAYAAATANLVISDSAFGVTGTNNVKAENKGTITLNNTVIQGTVKNHGLMAENGGYLYGKNITVRDTAGCAVRVKCSDAGNIVSIDGLVTENIGTHNVYINKDKDAGNAGSVVIKNGDLGRTVTHSVLANAGTLTLIQTDIQGHLDESANNVHAVYVCDNVEKVNLENVTVLDAAGDALRISDGVVVATGFTSQQTGRHGIWADGGKLTAQNTTISGSDQIGVNVTGGAVVLDGVQISGSDTNINVSGAALTVNGYADGSKSQIGTAPKDNIVVVDGGIAYLNHVDVQESAANNIVATGGKVYVTDATVTGGNYSVLTQSAGYAELTDVTITDPVKDGIRVNAADGKVVVNNVQILNPVRYGVSAEKGTVSVAGALTVTGKDNKSSGICVYNGGKVTTEDKAAVTVTGTEQGVRVESNGNVTMGNVTIENCAGTGVHMTDGTAVINGVSISGGGSNNILVTGGELTVNGYADGKKSQIGTSPEDNIKAIGTGVVRLNNVNILESAKNNVVAIEGGTVHMTDAAVTGGNHSILADKNGKVYLSKVSIAASKTSGIRANHTGSFVEATDVVIDGANTGLSIKCGTVQISNLTVRNTKAVGIDVRQSDADAKVTLNNLVTENCGTNAIYTSGAAAKLTVNGAKLSNDGSDHVIYLNGGPMVLHDVSVQAAAGKHELYSGAGWLTIGGAMDVNVHIATNPGRVIKVDKELTGNNLVIDWQNAPTGNALEFTTGDMMDASMDNIRLGEIQTNAGSKFSAYKDAGKGYAKLVNKFIANEEQLLAALTQAQNENLSEVTIQIGGSFTVSEQVTIPASVSKLTICDDGNTATGNTITYSGSTDGLFVVNDGLKLTLKDISMSATQKVLLMQAGGELIVNNCVLSSVKNSVKLTGGTAVLTGVNISGGTNNMLVTGGELTVNGYSDGKKSQIGTSTQDNIRVEGEGVIRLNNVNVLNSAKNNVVAINGGTVHVADSAVTGGNHSILADKNGKVYLNNVSIAASKTSGIRANHSGSYVEATDVTIDGAKTGVSFQSGTVEITNITIRNTKEVGVSVAQANSDAIVTLNNLVTENCGTYAIYTSGAAARLTVNGANLSNDGSDHVINLNGGPMVLHDVAVNANLTAGKYELYSGAGWLTIGGAMDMDIYIATNPGRVIKVNKELTGNNLVVDWKNAPTGNAFEFATEAIMNASKDNITLGKTQTDAGKQLYYKVEGAKAVALVKAQ